MQIPTLTQIIELLNTYPEKTGVPIQWSGATDAEIIRVSSEIGMPFSRDLVSWLKIVNCLELSALAFYGIEEIADVIRIIPEYREMSYLPIGSDLCGNHYVAILSENTDNPPVGFVEGLYGRKNINSMISSCINIFIYYSIYRSIDEDFRWPYKEETVLKLDPDIIKFPHPMAWNAK